MLQTAILGLGCGIIISSVTTKYRDLKILVGFGVNLWMYITPVIYPVSQVSGVMKAIIMVNPMSAIISNYRLACLGIGTFDIASWLLSLFVTILLFIIGVLMFNRVEKTFMDTV